MDHEATWRAFAPDALASRGWDDELVVYNDVTGSTHHLSVLGSAVMKTLLQHPSGISLTDLVRDIAGDPGSVGDGEIREAVERALAHLAELRLAIAHHA